MATIYWSASTGQTWNANLTGPKWSTSSTSQVNPAAPPTAADDVIFGAYTGPGGGVGNCTLGTAGPYLCRSLKFNSWAGTFNHVAGSSLNIGDANVTSGITYALSLSSSMTYTASGTLNFVSTSGTQQTITCAGKTLPVTSFSGAALSSYLLADTFRSTGTLTINNGIFNAGGNSITASSFNSSNANTRTITLGPITLSMGPTFWDTSTTTGLTNPLTAFSNCSITSSTAVYTACTFAGGGLTYLSLNAGAAFGANAMLTITGNNTFGTLTASTMVGGGGGGGMTFTAGGVTTITTSFGLVGAAGYVPVIRSSSAGSTCTLVGSQRIFAGTYLDIKDCIGAGETKWFAENSTNSGNNTNWRFNAPMYGAQSLLGCGI